MTLPAILDAALTSLQYGAVVVASLLALGVLIAIGVGIAFFWWRTKEQME